MVRSTKKLQRITAFLLILFLFQVPQTGIFADSTQQTALIGYTDEASATVNRIEISTTQKDNTNTVDSISLVKTDDVTKKAYAPTKDISNLFAGTMPATIATSTSSSSNPAPYASDAPVGTKISRFDSRTFVPLRVAAEAFGKMSLFGSFDSQLSTSSIMGKAVENFSLPGSTAGSFTINELAKFDKSVVMVESYDSTGELAAIGTGFCVGNGLFLTNFHVIESAVSMRISINDMLSYEVEGVVKYDRLRDLALIKTKSPLNITPLKLGSKSMLQKGDHIVAIGNPLGLTNTVSDGIVSGFRNFDGVDYVQITAPITHGSSGGPLFNMKGYVVGVNSAGYDTGNLNFAVSIDYAKGWVSTYNSLSFSSIGVIDMSKEFGVTWDDIDNAARTEIQNAFSALEKEDLAAYMSTIHSQNHLYDYIEKIYSPTFKVYDLTYSLDDIQILSRTLDRVTAKVTYTVRKVRGPEYRDCVMSGIYTLMEEDGVFKIYDSTEEVVKYLDDGIVGTQGLDKFLLNFEVTDAIAYPGKPIIFATERDTKKLFAINYETKSVSEMSFQDLPEHLTYQNGELFITLLKGYHSYYWLDKDQKGAVAVIDAESFQLKKIIDIDIDPFGIEVSKDGYIYVTSGSGQWTNIKSYSAETDEFIETKSGIRQKSYTAINPLTDVIYTVDSDTTPRSMSMYAVSEGHFTYTGFAPSINSYPMNTNFRVSPDGRYIFNGAGTIFYASMNYVTRLDKSFYDIAFDLDNNRFYTSMAGDLVYVYDYTGLTLVDSYRLHGQAVKLFYENNKLAAVTKIDGRYYIETLLLR